MDGRVGLRPVTETDIDLFDSAPQSEEAAGTYQWYGFTSTSGMRRRFAETRCLGADGGTFIIEFDKQIAGSIDWFKARWGREESWCWTIGIAVHPEYRGRGIGTQAHRLIVDYLFRHTRTERLQAFTDRENLAERRALEKAGFSEEGVIRSAQWRNGGWHDQVLYSILRAGWAPE